ncbi:hypothetical protein [Streptomyces sp. NPDC051665]|uniref:hypothetical protein n=1 Tax=Streptomyces sp. NPDC051665 TaxID=3154647 RepID=UPI003417253B
MSNGTLVVEALTTLAVLVHAYYAWAIAIIGTLTVLLLALVAVLNLLVARLRHPRKD